MTENEKEFETLECDAVYELTGDLAAVDEQDIVLEVVKLENLVSIHIGENGKLVINFNKEK